MAQQKRKQIVILGGSFAGISIAHNLLTHAIPRLADPASYQVVLVSPSTQSVNRPAAPYLIVPNNPLPQDKIFKTLTEVFAKYPADSFRFVHGRATSWDHAARTVTLSLAPGYTATEDINYHALVIATGALTHSPLFSFYGDATELRANWTQFHTALPDAKAIVIGGGGPTAIETAGELGHHLNGRAGWFRSKLDSPAVGITVVTSAPQILPKLKPEIAQAAEDQLAKVGVTVVKNVRVAEVSPPDAGLTASQLTNKAQLKLSNGESMTADIYIPATGLRPNSGFVKDKSLLAQDGRVRVHEGTMRVDNAGDRVYAIGDVSTYASEPAIHLLLEALPVLAANIKRDLLLAEDARGAGAEKSKEDRLYKEDMRTTQMVPIGRSSGVGSVMGWRVPGFMVNLIKGRDYWTSFMVPVVDGSQWSKEK